MQLAGEIVAELVGEEDRHERYGEGPPRSEVVQRVDGDALHGRADVERRDEGRGEEEEG